MNKDESTPTTENESKIEKMKRMLEEAIQEEKDAKVKLEEAKAKKKEDDEIDEVVEEKRKNVKGMKMNELREIYLKTVRDLEISRRTNKPRLKKTTSSKRVKKWKKMRD